MKVCEIIDFIEKTAPKDLAEGWDSPGLKTGSLNKEVSKILVCLDISPTVVREAVDNSCNMIITHHPLLFRPVGYICEDDEPALCLAIKNDIAVYSAHTNLDFAPNGINDILAKTLMLENIEKDDSKKHAYGDLKEPLFFNDFITSVKQNLNTPFCYVTFPNGQYNNKLLHKIGVSSGGFDGQTSWAMELGLDAIVTGEIKHSDCVDLQNKNIIVIGAGHYFTEIPGMKALVESLNKNGYIAILSKEENNPFDFY